MTAVSAVSQVTRASVALLLVQSLDKLRTHSSHFAVCMKFLTVCLLAN